MIDNVMDESERDQYLKPQPIRLDASVRGISSAATFVTISPPKNVLIKSPKFAVENELDMEMRNKKLKFEGKQVTKQMREAIERMLNPGKAQAEEAVQDFGIGILKKKQMTGQHNNTKRVFQKYQQFEQELASIRDKSELNRIKGQLDESNHALTVARLGGRLSNDYEKVLKAFNLNKKNLQIEVTGPEIMSTAGHFSPLKNIAKYRGSMLHMSQNWSNTSKSQQLKPYLITDQQQRTSKERVPINYVEKNKAVQPLHEVNREPHPLDRIEKQRRQSLKAEYESPRSPKTSPYLVKDGYGQVQIKHMTVEEVQLKEHKKSGIGAQILEKFTKTSPFNRDSIDGYKKLMNKVDRILDKEIIAHFELLSQDSEQAVQRPPLMSRQRRNYYSSTNLRKPFRRDRTVDSFTQVATVSKSSARPMSSYTRVASKQRPLILNPSGSSLVGVQTPSTHGSLAKSPSRTRIQSAHQKYVKSRKSISTVVSSQTGVPAFYANLPITATNSRGNGIGIFNSCGSSEGFSPKQMGLRSNPSHIKINSWTTEQRPKEVENTAFVTSP